jgi:hypothetical protein
MSHPLESFFLSYLNAENIPWEEVEPKVYDVLLTRELREILAQKTDLVRVCFDPEATAEHVGSQLLAVGDPALDGLFQQTITSGRSAHIFLLESNCFPQNLAVSIRQALAFTPDMTISFGAPRPLYFSKALFYFQITYLSDEKQQMLHSIGIDLHFGRISRHLETLLKPSEIVSSRPLPYPDASSISHEEGYRIAWNECSGKAKAGAAQLKQKLQTTFIKESQRLKGYFSQLREELAVRQEKTRSRDEDLSRFPQQLQAIDLEEKARFADLQKKSALQTEIRLVNVLWIEQLQILTPMTILHQGRSISIGVVWDPKMHRVEPYACPQCQIPTFHLATSDRGSIGCPHCLKVIKK